MLNSTGNTLNLGGGLPWSGTVTGAAGGYSGGSTPAYNPSTGNIIFGYTKSTVSQMVAVNQALETAGTGIQLSGYKYSWNINNDLNNSGGNRGIVYGNVSLKGPNGNVLESFNYDYSTRNLPGFTTFSGTQLFENRYSLSAVDNLTVSFTGKDQNFWAGYYGPRVHVNDLSLLYTTKPVPVVVDPCISDPLSSPACPGYALATVKNSILGSTVSNASATSYVPATNYNSPAPAAAPPGVADAAPALAQASPQQSAPQSSTLSQQQPGPDSNQNPGVAQDNPAQPSLQQAGPASTTPQPAGGPPQTATASSPASSAGPQQGGSSSGPSKLAMSVVKTAQANDKATQQAAVQNAAKTLENATQNSQASSNSAISMNQDLSANSAVAAANFASQTTQASMQVATQSNQSPQQTTQTTTQTQQTNKNGPQAQQQQQEQQQVQIQSTSLMQVQAPQQEQQQTQSQSSSSVVKLLPSQSQEQQQPQTQSTVGMMSMPQPMYTPPVQQQQDTQLTQIAMLKPPAPMVIEVQQQSNSGTGLTVIRNLFAYNPLMASNTPNMSLPLPTPQPIYQPKLDTRQSEVVTPQFQIATLGGAGRAGSPLSEILMQQRFELMQNNITQTGSSVNRNVQPNDLAVGVDLAVMSTVPAGFNAYSIVLKDATFYEPKEVYKNQRVVDNERVLRGLTRGSDRLHQEMVDQQYKGN
jgi:hypothetical protein